jgi:hypothetical protein
LKIHVANYIIRFLFTQPPSPFNFEKDIIMSKLLNHVIPPTIIYSTGLIPCFNMTFKVII